MSSEMGPKYIYSMPKNINSITIIITLENIFFTSAVRKHQQTLKCLLDFDWLLRLYNYLILTFYWFISNTF